MYRDYIHISYGIDLYGSYIESTINYFYWIYGIYTLRYYYLSDDGEDKKSVLKAIMKRSIQIADRGLGKRKLPHIPIRDNDDNYYNSYPNHKYINCNQHDHSPVIIGKLSTSGHRKEVGNPVDNLPIVNDK